MGCTSDSGPLDLEGAQRLALLLSLEGLRLDLESAGVLEEEDLMSLSSAAEEWEAAALGHDGVSDEAGPHSGRAAVIARRRAYEVLRRAFMSLLTEVVEARPVGEGAILKVRVRCPFCGYEIGPLTVLEAAGHEPRSRSRSGPGLGRPHDEVILAPLARHLRSAHALDRVPEVVSGGGERPWISARLTRYRCKLCGGERTGLMSALVHVIEHAWWVQELEAESSFKGNNPLEV